MLVKGATAVSHDGVEYEADEDGLVDLPADAARWVERVHGLVVVAERPVHEDDEDADSLKDDDAKIVDPVVKPARKTPGRKPAAAKS